MTIPIFRIQFSRLLIIKIFLKPITTIGKCSILGIIEGLLLIEFKKLFGVSNGFFHHSPDVPFKGFSRNLLIGEPHSVQFKSLSPVSVPSFKPRISDKSPTRFGIHDFTTQ